MAFSHVLQEYLETAGCSAGELAGACGLAPSTISRYLSGARTPDAATFPADAVARSLCERARQGGTHLDEPQVRDALLAAARHLPPQGADRKLAALLDTFGVTRTKLAAALGYSPSYVSRLCSGTRAPGDFVQFAQAAGRFFAERADAAGTPDALAALCPDAAHLPPEERVAAWLCAEEPAPRHSELEPFLRKLDAFDLERYMAALRFAEAPGPAAVPVPRGGTPADPAPLLYTGIEGFCAAELDFLACAAAEPAGTPVVLFSDMPMQDKMDASPGFPAAWVAALAALLRAGHPIENIHNVGRSLPEMMLGLEAWLPLYMTGMVRPHYLPSHQDGVFRHLVRCSAGTALEGQAIEGSYDHVGCQLFRDKASVAHFNRRARDLLARAKPLASICTAREARELAAFLDRQAARGGARTAILAAPPLFTMDEALLERVLDGCALDEQEARRVREAREAQLRRVETELAAGEAHVTVAYVEPAAFAAGAPNVALGEAFCSRNVPYDPQTYQEHVAQARRFAETHPAWRLTWGPDLGFRNLQIHVDPTAWALVSKNTSPAIHFVLRHRKMVEAFARFEMPVVE